MLIDCPGCARSYHVSDADLGARGRAVICPRCDARWYQDASGTIGWADRRGIDVHAANVRPAIGLDEPSAPLPPRPAPTRPATVAACIVLAGLALAGLFFGRTIVVAHVPRAATLYAHVGLPVNVVGLAFAKVTPDRTASSDMTIRGTLRNVAGFRMRIPRLAFEVRDAAGNALVSWSESVPAHTLAAGRMLDFASQPHRLPSESRTVLVRFD